MNQINFSQLGGFPLETETLLEVQKAYSIFNVYGKALGDKVIVSGCDEIGSNVTNGYIYLEGELMEFKGGVKQSKIVIDQIIQEVEFEDTNVKPVYYNRFATFGTGTTAIDWEGFKRIDPITSLMTRLDELEKTNAVFNSGHGSVWWRGSIASIPNGWIEDTTMRGLVPVGYDPGYRNHFDEGSYNLNTIGTSGGVREHAITLDEMPEHKFDLKTSDGGDDNTHSNDYLSPGDKEDRGHTGTQYTNELGGDKKHTNMQPYRVGVWIKRQI